MEARISIVTLGVTDLDRARRFYRDGLGWRLSAASNDGIAFFRAGGTVVALYPRNLLAADANLPASGTGFGGITLAHNVASKALVNASIAQAVAAGARLLKPAADAFWGGYSGYIADPDGYPWEVAWNPGFAMADDGSLVLPD